MKKKSTIFFFVQFFAIIHLQAQTPPQAISYQAVARDNAGALLINQSITVRFSILDAFATGAVLYQERHTVSTNPFALFSVSIGTGVVVQGNFSSINWGSGEKYLKIEMDPTGGTSYYDMGTSQFLAVPYALYAAKAASGGSLDNAYDFGGAGQGRIISADTGPVEVNTGTETAALICNNLRTNGGTGLSGIGFSGIAGDANNVVGFGVFGENLAAASGVRGGNQVAPGMGSIGFLGLLGQTQVNNGAGVLGANFGTTRDGSVNNAGVEGEGYIGVIGSTNTLTGGTPGWGVYSFGDMGSNEDIYASDNLVAGGTKSFRIDHPHDPANKFLFHFAMESNEVLNFYRGTEQLDANGEAVITLPDYFEAVNTNYSYHLTAIGAQSDLYVKHEIQNNRFTVAGGQPGSKVSWQVVAERNDPYMAQHPEAGEDERTKSAYQQGKYVHPLEYGKTPEDALQPKENSLQPSLLRMKENKGQ